MTSGTGCSRCLVLLIECGGSGPERRRWPSLANAVHPAVRAHLIRFRELARMSGNHHAQRESNRDEQKNDVDEDCHAASSNVQPNPEVFKRDSARF